jgi:hypothetical protein
VQESGREMAFLGRLARKMSSLTAGLISMR